jgi:hypothetical protein
LDLARHDLDAFVALVLSPRVFLTKFTPHFYSDASRDLCKIGSAALSPVGKLEPLAQLAWDDMVSYGENERLGFISKAVYQKSLQSKTTRKGRESKDKEKDHGSPIATAHCGVHCF